MPSWVTHIFASFCKEFHELRATARNQCYIEMKFRPWNAVIKASHLHSLSIVNVGPRLIISGKTELLSGGMLLYMGHVKNNEAKV